MKQTLAIALAIFLISFPSISQTTNSPLPQTSSPWNIGSLGKRYGEKIEITGTCGPELMTCLNPILVTSIDGKKVSQPIILETRNRHTDKLTIEKGYTYTIIGYESAGYEGPPEWSCEGAHPPQQPFQFKRFFVPVKLIKTEKLPVDAKP